MDKKKKPSTTTSSREDRLLVERMVAGDEGAFETFSDEYIPALYRFALYRLNREYLRHLIQRLRGRPPYEIHFLAREDVETIIQEAGGELVEVTESGRRRGGNFRYCAVRRA